MFKKTKIAAVSAVILGLSSMAAQADYDHKNKLGVALNDGASGGEVLIFPYYNVNNEFITVYNITNTTGAYKALKIRFRESENSNDVMDFNVYLSPYDVFTMQLQIAEPAPEGGLGEGGVLLTTTDKSCVHPAIPEGGLPFRYGIYDKTDVNDVREGYLEVIEMGELDEEAYVLNKTTGKPQRITDQGVLHKADGVPVDCSVIETAWQQAVFVQGGAKSNGRTFNDIDWVNPKPTGYPNQPIKSDKHYYGERWLNSEATDTLDEFAFEGTPIHSPKGGIVGTSILVDLATIIGFVAEPTSVLHYSKRAQHYLSSDKHFYQLPSLASGSNKLAYRSQGQLVEYDRVARDWGLDDRNVLPKISVPSGINPMPIADAMLVSTLGNQYFLGGTTVTDLVVAAPMRKHAIYNDYKYVEAGVWNSVIDLPPEDIAVGSNPTKTPAENGILAEQYGYWEFQEFAFDVNADLTYYDREEASYTVQPDDFSPPFTEQNEIVFGKEVNIFALRRNGVLEGSVLGSNNARVLELEPGFVNGWLSFAFDRTLDRHYNLKGRRYEAWLDRDDECKGHLVDDATAALNLAADAADTDDASGSDYCRTVFMRDQEDDDFDARGVPLHGFMAARVPARGGFVGEAFPHFYTRDRGHRRYKGIDE